MELRKITYVGLEEASKKAPVKAGKKVLRMQENTSLHVVKVA